MLRLVLMMLLVFAVGCSLPTLDERPNWTRTDALPPGSAGTYPSSHFLWRGPNAKGEERKLSRMLGTEVHRGYGIVPGTFGGSPFTQALRAQIGKEAEPIDDLEFSWIDVLKWKYRGTHGEAALTWSILERSAVLTYYMKRARVVSDELEETLTALSTQALPPRQQQERWLEGLERAFRLDVLRAFCVALGAEARDPVFRRLTSSIRKTFAGRLEAVAKGLKGERRTELLSALAKYSPDASGRRVFEGAPQAPTAPKYPVPARQPTEVDAQLDRIEAACGPKIRAQAAILLRPDPFAMLLDRKATLGLDPTAKERDLEERRAALREIGALIAMQKTPVGKPPPALVLLTDAFEETRYAAAAAEGMAAAGPKAAPAVPELIAVLGGKLVPVGPTQLAVVSALAAIGTPPAIQALEGAAKRCVPLLSAPGAPAPLVELVSRMGPAGKAALPALMARLRAGQVSGLVGLGAPGREALKAACADRSLEVRRRAVRAYSACPGADVAVLLPLRTHADPALRRIAIRGLGQAGRGHEQAVVPVLRALLTEKDPQDRAAAASALGSLGPGAVEAVLDLVAAMRGDLADEVVLRSLGEIGPAAIAAAPRLLAHAVRNDARTPTALLALIQLRSKLSGEARAEVVEAAVPLLAASAGPTSSFEAAIECLVKFAPESVPTLLKAANRKSEPLLRERALIALGRSVPRILAGGLGDKATTDLLAAIVPVLLEVKAGRALPAAGAGLSQVVVALEPELFHKDRARRQFALRLMLQIGPLSYRALVSLRVLLNDDPDPSMRTQAAAVLSAIGLEAGPAIDDLENAAKRDPDAKVKAAAKNAFERVEQAVKAKGLR